MFQFVTLTAPREAHFVLEPSLGCPLNSNGGKRGKLGHLAYILDDV